MPTTQYSLQIVHPAFELLKRSARVLHFIAASVIFINALHVLQVHHASPVLCYTQMIIAADIFILVFFGGSLLVETPKLNLIFRLCEVLTLFGITVTLFGDGHYWYGIIHAVATAGYLFLFYREWRVMRSEAVDISQTGITVPNFIKDAEISWNEIKTIIPKYHSILIETLRNQKIEFNLRENLKIDELGQIDEFCKKHMVAR
ncbi:hypothetical protein [Ferruginibacter sp. SUN106]|uniref:hypothetical protein n=1 Tax=Ferruginibacter sp. SUN106 TaxID=2978348 RepID=UPI003D3601BA